MRGTEMEILSRVGDVCAEDHGGGAIVRDEDGYVYLEYTHGLESDHPGEDRYGDEVADLKLTLYRVQLDEPAWKALSGCGSEEKLWTEVARSAGQDPEEVIEMAKSEDPMKIAGCFEMFAGHWGWGELDHYPIELPYHEVETRWGS
jgi:hypothetical protein